MVSMVTIIHLSVALNSFVGAPTLHHPRTVPQILKSGHMRERERERERQRQKGLFKVIEDNQNHKTKNCLKIHSLQNRTDNFIAHTLPVSCLQIHYDSILHTFHAVCNLTVVV